MKGREGEEGRRRERGRKEKGRQGGRHTWGTSGKNSYIQH
jgi:hypothetical protein